MESRLHEEAQYFGAIEDAKAGYEDEIQSLRQQVAELEADAKRWNYFIETCAEEVAFSITGITGDVTNEQINEAIDAAMEKQNDN